MKIWKVQETTVNADAALEMELNRLEKLGAKIQEVILVHTYNMPGVMYIYKIIYTLEDDIENETNT